MFNIMHMHVMFRLVGGDASPPSPPLNPPLIVLYTIFALKTPQFYDRMSNKLESRLVNNVSVTEITR